MVTGWCTQTPINLYTGAAMGAFGAIMLMLTYRANSST